MKQVVTIGVCLLTSCSYLNDTANSIKDSYAQTVKPALVKIKKPIQPAIQQLPKNKLWCRITYYCGLDKWGNLVADPKTKVATAGITVAAHPDFSFGQKIEIPALKGHVGDGKFIVQDRGSAVTKKKAARGKAYVFDVYVKTAAEMHRNSNRLPEYMDVYILE